MVCPKNIETKLRQNTNKPIGCGAKRCPFFWRDLISYIQDLFFFLKKWPRPLFSNFLDPPLKIKV